MEVCFQKNYFYESLSIGDKVKISNYKKLSQKKKQLQKINLSDIDINNKIERDFRKEVTLQQPQFKNKGIEGNK